MRGKSMTGKRLTNDGQMTVFSMPADLDEILRHHRPGLSRFEIEREVVEREGITPWGQYQQALRELNTRTESLKRDYIARERAERRMKSRDKLDAREGAADFDSLQRTIRHREKEAAVCLEIVQRLRPQFAHITEADEGQLDADHWEAKVLKLGAIDVFRCGSVSALTVDLARSLPDEQRSRVLALLSQPQLLAGQELGRLPCR